MKFSRCSRFIRLVVVIIVCGAGSGALSAEDTIQSLVARLGAGEDVSEQLMSHGVNALPAIEEALLAADKNDSGVEDKLLAHTGELLLNAETRLATLRMLRAVVCEKPQFLTRYQKTRLILKGAREAEGILSSYTDENVKAWRVGGMKGLIGVSPELAKLEGKKVRIVGRWKERGPGTGGMMGTVKTSVEKWYIPSERLNPYSGTDYSDIMSCLTTTADVVTKQDAIDELASRGGAGIEWIQKNFDSSSNHIKVLLIDVLDKMCHAMTSDLPEQPYYSWHDPVKTTEDDLARLELIKTAREELERIASQHKEYAVQIDRLRRIHALDILNNLFYLFNFGPSYLNWTLDMVGTDSMGNFCRSTIKDYDLLILAPYMDALTRLDIQDTRISNLGLSYLSNLKNLEVLRVGNRTLEEKSKCINLKGIKTISSLKKLKELYIGNVYLGDKGLSELAVLVNLETLSCDGESGVRDKDLAHIGKLKNLNSLVLANSNISGDGLKHLQGLTKLESLNLSLSNKLKTIKHIKPIKTLRVLILTQISQHLTAEALSEIAGMELHELNVTLAPLDGELDKVVGKFPALKKLYTYRPFPAVRNLVPADCQLIKEQVESELVKALKRAFIEGQLAN